MNMKRIFQKIIVVLLTAVLWILPVQSVQAAGMSYSKASQLYTEAQCRWIAHPRKVKITDDLRAVQDGLEMTQEKSRLTQAILFGYVLLDTDGFERRWSTGVSCSDTGWSIDNLDNL